MDPPGIRDALALVGATAATEAVLLRVTGGQALASGDLLALLGVSAGLVVVILAAARLSMRTGALVAGLPLTLTALWVSLPVVMDHPGAGPFLVALALLSVFLGVRSGLRSPARWPTPRVAIASVLGMALLTWAVEALSQGTSPAGWQVLGMAGGGLALLLLGRFAVLLAVLLAVPTLLGSPPSTGTWTATGPVPEGPDVVLLTVDTLRADAGGGLAAVARLAMDGTVLEGQAASPWTLPSMASLMTGLEPQHHGAGRDGDGGFHGLAPGVATLASALAAAGWDTAASIENPFVGRGFGLPRGFARVVEVGPVAFALPRQPLSDRCRLWEASLLARVGLLAPLADGAARHVEQAAALLADRRDRPLLLWVHLFDPHLPYHHAVDLDLPLSRRLSLATLVRESEDQAAPEGLDDLRAAYDHEVAVTDHALLDLLDLLGPVPARGRIVVLTSDHGEEFGEHGGWEHGHSMYQELLAVPLVISGIDGLQPGRAGLVDVAPTVLAAVGVALADLDGRDLAGGPSTVVRANAPLYGPADLRAVLAGSHKAIQHGDDVEAFDLERDPGEQQPLRVDPILRALLPPPYVPAGQAADVDPAIRSRLEALGYVDE